MTSEVDELLSAYPDWRASTLGMLRLIIRGADARIEESIKWRKPSNPLGVLAWSASAIICTGEVYRAKVKLTFFRGAALVDPAGLFGTATSGTRRTIDFACDDNILAEPLAGLVRQAVNLP